MPDITYRDALRQAMSEAMREDSRIYLLGEDIGAYGGSYAVTKGMLAEFGPERVRDTPIAESVIAGLATGSAMAGLLPIVELMTANFSLLALDQIVNHAAKLHYMFNGQIHVPMIVRVPAGWGQLAATHSQTFDNWFAYVPGLKVLTPAVPEDAHGMMRQALRDNNPIIFGEHSLIYNVKGRLPGPGGVAPIGRAVVRREGADVSLISYSRMLHVCLAAAEQLATQGIEAEVVDLRSLRPLDVETVAESVRKTNRAVVAEEGWLSFGVGAEIASVIYENAFDYLDAPVARVAALEVPLPYARNLERMAMPDEARVLAAVRAVLPPSRQRLLPDNGRAAVGR